MPITVRPSASPDRPIDVTHALVKAVAEELWRTTGGNDVLNWIEAERFVQSLMQRPSSTTEPLPHPRGPRNRDVRHVQPLRREEPRYTEPLPVY